MSDFPNPPTRSSDPGKIAGSRPPGEASSPGVPSPGAWLPAVALVSFSLQALTLSPLRIWVLPALLALDVAWLVLLLRSHRLGVRRLHWIDLAVFALPFLAGALSFVPGVQLLLGESGALLFLEGLRWGRVVELARLGARRTIRHDSVGVKLWWFGVALFLVLLSGIDRLSVFHHGRFLQDRILTLESIQGSFRSALRLPAAGEIVAWQEGEGYFHGTDEPLTASEYQALRTKERAWLVPVDDKRSVLMKDRRAERDQTSLLFWVLLIPTIGTALVFLLLSLPGEGRPRESRRQELATGDSPGQTGRDDLDLREERDVEDETFAVEENPEEGFVDGVDGPVPDEEESAPPLPEDGAVGEPPVTAARLSKELSDLESRLLESLSRSQAETALRAVRLSARSILDHLKKNGNQA